MSESPVYLDHHATTPVDPRVVEAMLPYFTQQFGNAASRTHAFGQAAQRAVEEARERIASVLGASAREVVFTSGATESNNLAILGAAEAYAARGKHVITLATEHKAVLDPVAHLAEKGYETTILAVEPTGLLEIERLEAAIRDDTVLVSVMAANNEIGVLQDLAAIGRLTRDRGVLLHTDAAQAIGKVELRVDEVPVDLLSISGHKVYGPKGIGVLWLRGKNPRVRLRARQFGGGHERGLRSGTLDVPAIVGIATALELGESERAIEARRLGGLRDRLCERILGELDDVVVHGDRDRRLPGNLNLGFGGVPGEALLTGLRDIAVSSGSACTSADPQPSHVLAAIGVSPQVAHASLRFGIGRHNTTAEIDRAAARVVEVVRHLRAIYPGDESRFETVRPE